MLCHEAPEGTGKKALKIIYLYAQFCQAREICVIP